MPNDLMLAVLKEKKAKGVSIKQILLFTSQQKTLKKIVLTS